MAGLLSYFFRRLTDWLFRRKSPGIAAMRYGTLLLGFALAVGWAFDVSFPIQEARFSLKIDSSGGAPAALTWLAAGLGFLLLAGGSLFEIVRYGHDRKYNSKKRVLVIEGRGLRDGPGRPLADALPADVEGRREPYVLDLRQRVEDGKIVDPTRIIEKIESLPSHIDHMAGGQDRSDLTLAYGGLTAVPFTFLTGIMLDDEDKLVVLDWDRNREAWRPLDGADDGQSFVTTGLKEVSTLMSYRAVRWTPTTSTRTCTAPTRAPRSRPASRSISIRCAAAAASTRSGL